MNKQSILNDFKKYLVEFVDELIQTVPSEGQLVIVRYIVKDKVPIETIMDMCVDKLIKFKPKIKNRDPSFFLEENDIFEGIPIDISGKIRTIWESGNLDIEDKDALFRWFEMFVVLAEKYKNLS